MKLYFGGLQLYLKTYPETRIAAPSSIISQASVSIRSVLPAWILSNRKTSYWIFANIEQCLAVGGTMGQLPSIKFINISSYFLWSWGRYFLFSISVLFSSYTPCTILILYTLNKLEGSPISVNLKVCKDKVERCLAQQQSNPGRKEFWGLRPNTVPATLAGGWWKYFNRKKNSNCELFSVQSELWLTIIGNREVLFPNRKSSPAAGVGRGRLSPQIIKTTTGKFWLKCAG